MCQLQLREYFPPSVFQRTHTVFLMHCIVVWDPKTSAPCSWMTLNWPLKISLCVSPHLNFKYVIKHKLIKYLTRIRKQKLNEETVAIQIFALPGVSPKGFGGLAVTLELLGCVVLCLLGCAVVITAYVLWGLRVVVLVTGTVVVEGAKEVTVAFGVTFASSSHRQPL